MFSERHNNVVRIFEAESYTCIAVLQQKGRITSIRWDNVLYKARLLICTASPFLFVWSPDGCEIYEMPSGIYDKESIAQMELFPFCMLHVFWLFPLAGFACNEATWNSLGTSLLVKNQVQTRGGRVHEKAYIQCCI
ncbi:WD repeat-containing protein WRAP73, putative [Plasmodium ovale wallikeri]|uniref:WD repeat-containing protein WRAP73, putative n=1 Tax=Plasmodium ovale wallikeri TaxID=864142 RepID=A0A1A8YTJ3_PLAOA|nr:WD repeat-containing protein WRAP73, putative [Plasmodium ovale wallikeri]SBT35271.1 WD repeat-containing protein WRAP73, putative [Plasmodium ovale wallikeri]